MESEDGVAEKKHVNTGGSAGKKKKSELGSKTAKGGFANEKAICKKFNAKIKDIFDLFAGYH